MTTHILKTDRQPFEDVAGNRKHFDIRKDDRNFQIGDVLILQKTAHTGEEMKTHNYPLVYTGDICVRLVTHIMRGPRYGLAEGYVIMSLEPRNP